MANWWEAAPLATDKPADKPAQKSWWEAAPLAPAQSADGSGIAIRPVGQDRSVTDRLKGAYKALDAGAASGLAGLGGSLGDLTDLGATGIEAASNYVADMIGAPRYERPKEPSITDKIPRSRDVQKFIQDTYYGGAAPYEPQDQPEKYLKTVGEFSIGGGLGPATARTLVRRGAQRIGQVVAPAVTSETAGQVADNLADDNKAAEPIARFLGAIVGGGAHALATRSRTPRAVLERQLPEGVTPQMVDQADALMRDAARLPGSGVPLTWAEALSQVAGRPVLTNLQRHLEASPQSERQMGEFFAQRPQQVERAADAATEALAPGPVTRPSTIGPAVGRAAESTVNDIRGAINQATQPLYDAAGQHLVPRQVHAAMMADPLFEQTVNTIRNDPARNALVRGASDRSVSMYDAVAKELEQRSRNAAQITNPDANQMISSVTGRLGGDIKDVAIVSERAATHGPSSYEAALARQTELRERYLNPILQGPLGKLADKDITTKNAIDVLFPAAGETQRHGQHEVAEAVRAVAQRNPRAASDLVRAHAESVFDTAARDLQTGPNQAGGAKFRTAIAGTRQQRENLRAAVEAATPDGAQRWQGFNRFLDIMEATGTRQNVGSRTAYNQEIKQQMTTAGGAVATGTKVAANPTKFLQPLADKFDQWRYGQNLDQLATILTDPNSAAMLRSIADAGANSWQGMQQARALVNYANAVGARRNDQPTQ